uniref:TLC domain-containing protein n=2 Tax=Odontella aurita TaxID=265563 RepID=A0A7S4IMR3_9STRA|mmetsp:Transcript_2738/g.7173  ORF Transcript_2738/g.7173 Transcript_2738/m.7173 type:complete len:292 (+) Transcript_2738:151-1026(+)
MSFLATTEEIEEIGALHSNPAFLPDHHIDQSLRQIGTVVAIITVVQLVFLQIFRSRLSKGSDQSSAWKSSYQFTNLLVNLFLGVLGIYHYYFTLPRPALTVSEKVEGWESLSIFSDIQIGYQLWALPVGYFFVGETSGMMFHHVQVVVVGCLSAFFWNGFRYVTPFFYGLIEISSVPLSVMNYFKTRPELIKERPTMYTVVRLIFSVVFLTVRVVMWVPNMFDWLKTCGILCYTCDNASCYAGLGLSMLAGFGLTVLQMVWASKIVEGLLKAAAGGGKKKKSAEDNSEKKD